MIVFLVAYLLELIWESQPGYFSCTYFITVKDINVITSQSSLMTLYIVILCQYYFMVQQLLSSTSVLNTQLAQNVCASNFNLLSVSRSLTKLTRLNVCGPIHLTLYRGRLFSVMSEALIGRPCSTMKMVPGHKGTARGRRQGSGLQGMCVPKILLISRMIPKYLFSEDLTWKYVNVAIVHETLDQRNYPKRNC